MHNGVKLVDFLNNRGVAGQYEECSIYRNNWKIFSRKAKNSKLKL